MLVIRRPLFWMTLLATALIAPMAFASGDAGHGAPHVANWFSLPIINIDLNESIKAPALFWLFVTFAIYIGIIAYVMYKKMPGFLLNRSELIRHAIEEATQAKQEAEQNARLYEDRMSKLDDEIEQLRSDFATQGQSELERVEKSAETAAVKMQKDTEATIEAELHKAIAELQTETAKLAYSLATDKLEKSLTTADQARLEDAFLEDLNRQAQA